MSLELIVAIIGGALIPTIALLYAIWRHRQEKPFLKAEILNCRHRGSSRGEYTDVRLRFKVHNSGKRATTLTRLDIAVPDGKKKYHTMSEQMKVDIAADESTEILDILFRFAPPFEYLSKCHARFALKHTHGSHLFDAFSHQSDESLTSEGFLII